MMKVQIFLLLSWAAISLAGPARRDCGETKSFIGTNSCGATFGGTWVECATDVSAIKTFFVPTCAPTPASTSEVIWVTRPTGYEINATATAPPPNLITAAPEYNATGLPPWANSSTPCSPLFICVDCLAVCGGKSSKYGDCYDTCTPHTISSPECTLPSALPTPPPRFLPDMSATSTFDLNITVPKLGIYKAPVREQKSWCLGASFMCAPKGWVR